MKCPSCGSDLPDNSTRCDLCLLVFSRPEPQLKAAPSTQRPLGPPSSEEEPDPVPRPRAMDTLAWIHLAVGFGGGVLILLVPLVRFIFSYLGILIHELGHTLAGWLLGFPSVPAFDFMYGGGVTITDRDTPKTVDLVAIYLLLILFMVLCRRNRLTLTVLILAGLFHLCAVLTQLHTVIILFMGHGFELVIGILFVYRALSGSAVLVSAERPIYGMSGFFLLLNNLVFAYRLTTSVGARWEYGEAKGGGHWMDFSQIADAHLHLPLESVAGLFFIVCLVTPFVALAAYRYQEYLGALWTRLREATPLSQD